MNKKLFLAIIATFFLIFITTSNFSVIQGSILENTNTEVFLKQFETSIINESTINNYENNDHKVAQEAEVLGWKINDQQSDFDAASFYVTAICVGLSENVVVLVESVLINDYTETRGNNIAEDFQNKIYTPTADALGVPKASDDYPNENNIVLLIVDRDAHSVGWVGVYFGQINGYEQITVDRDLDWSVIAHEYQHCIHQHLRPVSELYFNEGMSELWPNYLEITSNRCSDDFWECLTSAGYGQNTPLLEYGPYGSPYFIASYGIGYAFAFYIYEQYGMDFIRAIISDTNYSISQAIVHQLPFFGYDDTNFRQIFFDFQMALRLNSVEYNPKWGYSGLPLYVEPSYGNSESSLPLDMDVNVFHWAGVSHSLSLSSPDFAALKYTFNGSETGDFDVHVIGSSFYNYSYTEEFVSHMTINNETQDGEIIFILPSKVAYVYINIANANGPDRGYVVPNTDVFATLRDSASIQIEAFDPGLVGIIENLSYEDREFNITATVDWDLDTSLVENDLAPHIVLYDADGEFAFNLQSYLTYDEASDKWLGKLDISEDIKAGKYILKLFVRGVELDSEEGSVSGASATGFLFFPISIAFVSLIFIRRRRE